MRAGLRDAPVVQELLGRLGLGVDVAAHLRQPVVHLARDPLAHLCHRQLRHARVEPVVVDRDGGLVRQSTIGTRDSQIRMAWRVPDIHAAVPHLRARGVCIEEYVAPDPVTVGGIADMGHSRAAWFMDPSDNCLAVVQPKG
jgi:hypothetical protein